MIVSWLAYWNRNILDLILYRRAYDTKQIVQLALHRMLLNTNYNNKINTILYTPIKKSTHVNINSPMTILPQTTRDNFPSHMPWKLFSRLHYTTFPLSVPHCHLHNAPPYIERLTHRFSSTKHKNVRYNYFLFQI